MKLYIANCTSQAQSVNFRMIESKSRGFSTQNIAMGQQVQLAGELNKPQIDYIVDQLEVYGLRSVEGLDGVREFVPLLYSVDKHVPSTLMERLIQYNRGLLKDRGQRLRREAAIATSHGMRALGMPQAADNVSLSVEEEKAGTMDHGGDEPLAEGFRMTREIAADMAEATLSGYLVWIRDVMRVPEEALADTSPYIEMSFWFSQTLVNDWLYLVGTDDPTQAQPTMRALCVYNLGGATLCQICQDDPDLPPPWNTYWQDLRGQFGLNGFTPGVIQSSADQGTSASYKVSAFFDTLTPTELALMQTPWGRFYMSMASFYGPTIWGAVMTTLHLGVIDQPYRNASIGHKGGKTGKPGKKRKAHITSKTTFDVAKILEAHYHIMENFFGMHTQEFLDVFLNSYMGNMETAMMRGTPVQPPKLDKMKKVFNDFIDQEELAGVVPGVPTQAALHGVSHRFKHPYAKRPRRPSFIDTGLYEASFMAWVD